MKFLVKLPFFEGPFALLLFFVEKQEVDIHKVSISGLIRDFLAYINQAKRLNITLAGDFIVVAARLMQLKARGLLPAPPAEAPDEAETEEQLIGRLKAYQAYRRAASVLEKMGEERAKKAERGNRIQMLADLFALHRTELEMEKITPNRLLRAYLRLQKRHQEQKTHPYPVRRAPYTVDGQKKTIMDLLHIQKKMHFRDLLAVKKQRDFAVYGLLALLDLAQEQKVALYGTAGFNNFWMRLSTSR